MKSATPIMVIGLRGLGICSIVAGMALLSAGCRDNTPPPPRVPVPASLGRDPSAVRDRDEVRPLPPPSQRPIAARPPFDDPPLVDQRVPEQSAFVEVYRKVNSPKITLFVNRSLEGSVIPVNRDDPSVTIDRTRRSSGPLSVESHDSYSANTDASAHHYGGWYDSHGDYHAYARGESTDKFEAKGPAEYHDTTDVYLHPGQYDELQARSLDYEAVENIMTDWIACNGGVTVISPTLARQRLTDEQVKDLQSGRPQVLSEVAQQLGADVLIQVQAHPTRQTAEGIEFRVVAEAMNTHGGQSLGRAVVDMQPPLEKTTINRYTRFLARKLMQEMTDTWSAPPPPEMRRPDSVSSPTAPPPTPQRSTVSPSFVPPPPASAAPPGSDHPVMPPLFAPSSPPPAPIPATAPTTGPSQLP